MTGPALAVVVVAYGDPGHLERCLTTLAAPSGHVVVVDNGRDPRVEVLVQRYGASYVLPDRNLGFAAGVNLGLSRVAPGRPDVLLLNPDAELSWPDVERLQLALHAEACCAAVAPRLVRPDGSEEAASWPMPSPLSWWLDALGASRLYRGRRFLTGAAMLLSGEALAEVGGFDERYFLYAEESDWQMSAQRAGWTVRVVPEVRATHVGGGTSEHEGTRSEHFYRSAGLFRDKWYGRVGTASMRAASRVAALRRRR